MPSPGARDRAGGGDGVRLGATGKLDHVAVDEGAECPGALGKALTSHS